MLTLKNVSKYYHSNDVVALGLRKVNLELNLGEFIAVTGESGSGKSTLLNVISGLDTYEDGEMFVNGEETSYFSIADWESYRRQYIGFVFQNYNIIDSYSVYENVMVALKIQGYDPEKRKERALELIKKVGLESHTHHKASKLSGGQKQRAVIARALAKDCPIIVADEPTGNLDSESSDVIMKLLQEIAKDKLVIVVTHNFEEVEDYATRRIRLFDGEIIEDKTLRSYVPVVEEVKLQNYIMNLWSLLTFSFRNLYRTPRRTIFQSIVFIFIVLIFTLTYGFFARVVNEAGGSSYNAVFNNVTDRRIIVTKKDATAFTPQEILALEGLDDVNEVFEHDIVNDSTSYTLEIEGEEGWQWINTMPHYNNPSYMLSKEDLLSGRLPESKYEIVVELKQDVELGDTIYVTTTDSYYYDEGDRDSLENFIAEQGEPFTVVGIVESEDSFSWYGNLYFHKDFFESDEMISSAYLGGWESPYSMSVSYNGQKFTDLGYYQFMFDDSLGVNEIVVTEDFVYNAGWAMNIENDEDYTDAVLNALFQLDSESTFSSESVQISISSILTWGQSDSGEYMYYNDDYPSDNIYRETVILNPQLYYSLVDTDSYQLTVYIPGRFVADDVMEDIDDLGYNAIFPETIEDPFSALGRVVLTFVFGILMVFLMAIMYLITYMVLKNVQEAKKKDFLIFRSIGASKSSLNKVTIYELLALTIFGILVVFVLFYLNSRFIWIRQIANLMDFFTLGNYIFLFIILFALAFLLGRRFNSRIFNKSVITSLKAE
jgi:ABC-type lipoprotein export system ATPase subunit/ABC-type antimicrobial peptide transport system permease subunit